MRVVVLILAMLVLAGSVGPGASRGQPAGQEEPAGAAGTPAAAAAEDLEEFVPTEEISADSAISFPVDI